MTKKNVKGKAKFIIESTRKVYALRSFDNSKAPFHDSTNFNVEHQLLLRFLRQELREHSIKSRHIIPNSGKEY